MTDRDIRNLIDKGTLPAGQVCEELIETHISWVILCRDYVYKLKKPLRFSFLDFSTLEKRKQYCERELFLNRRLAPGIYLDVKPVTLQRHQLSIDGDGEIVDYALVMKRMDNRREMGKLLVQEKVKKRDIRELAIQLAAFHAEAEVIPDRVSPEGLMEDFSDILSIADFVEQVLGADGRSLLEDINAFAGQFIEMHHQLIRERSSAGFVRDCHGDLHSGNIFLLEKPVIFDCIEFNDHFRQIDILNELAFFCMDLEFYGRKDLSDHFIKVYSDKVEIITSEEEQDLFLFYKLYRANVKTKVNAIKAMQTEARHDTKDRLDLFRKYFLLMESYYRQLSGRLREIQI
jgi:uncharacterized protein